MSRGVTDVVASRLPRSLFPPVYSVFTRIHPDRDPVSYSRVDGCYEARNRRTGETIYVHDGTYLYRVQSESSSTFCARLESKYTLDGFAEVSAGDVVVDCGAHVGGFTLAVADRAEHVFAVEPDPRLQRALSLTLADVASATLHNVALSDESRSVEFLLSDNPSENSLIDVDTGTETDRVTVETTTLAAFVEASAYDSIDFLKADAEGAEPEVLRGLGDLRPRTVAIDAGPERRGERTRGAVVDILTSMDYETREEHDVVFGRHED